MKGSGLLVRTSLQSRRRHRCSCSPSQVTSSLPCPPTLLNSFQAAQAAGVVSPSSTTKQARVQHHHSLIPATTSSNTLSLNPPSQSVQVAQAAGVVTLSSPTKQGQPGTPGRGPAGTAAAAGGQGAGGAAAAEEDEDALVDPVDEVRVQGMRG